LPSSGISEKIHSIRFSTNQAEHLGVRKGLLARAVGNDGSDIEGEHPVGKARHNLHCRATIKVRNGMRQRSVGWGAFSDAAIRTLIQIVAPYSISCSTNKTAIRRAFKADITTPLMSYFSSMEIGRLVEQEQPR
jgi:hypothetical protein